MNQQQAKLIAQELINSGKISDQTSFTVTSNDLPTDDLVVVITIKTNNRGEQALRKIAESIATKAVAGPKGIVCPVCNGTGRVG